MTLVLYRTTGESPAPGDAMPCAAMVMRPNVDGRDETTAAMGNGPVNALDLALRKALTVFYPQLAQMRLTDFKVRVFEADAATGARVRVLIESTDGDAVWTTVGVSADIIEASWRALVDSIEFKLTHDEEKEEARTMSGMTMSQKILGAHCGRETAFVTPGEIDPGEGGLWCWATM